MRIASALFLIFAAVIFAVGGLDILANAAEFEAEAQIRSVGFGLIALSVLCPLLAVTVLFAKAER
jgi:hypothetical protein